MADGRGVPTRAALGCRHSGLIQVRGGLAQRVTARPLPLNTLHAPQ
jgi:hypothetical protein